MEIKRQFEIRRANIQNIIKENDELVKNSKVRAAESTIKEVGGLQLSVRIYQIYYHAYRIEIPIIKYLKKTANT